MLVKEWGGEFDEQKFGKITFDQKNLSKTNVPEKCLEKNYPIFFGGL